MLASSLLASSLVNNTQLFCLRTSKASLLQSSLPDPSPPSLYVVPHSVQLVSVGAVRNKRTESGQSGWHIALRFTSVKINRAAKHSALQAAYTQTTRTGQRHGAVEWNENRCEPGRLKRAVVMRWFSLKSRRGPARTALLEGTLRRARRGCDGRAGCPWA
jgi:hypothetical protein